MKNIFLVVLCSALVIGTTSCKKEQDDIFDKSSADRLQETARDYTNLLRSSANGWAMEYFPNEVSAGEIFLMKFEKDSVLVTCQSKNVNGNEYTEDISAWEVITDNGPVLSFDTNNKIIHTFSDPGQNGTGFGGDYEFMLLRTIDNGNTLVLKGKKTGTYIEMTKLEDGEFGKSYFNRLTEMDRALFYNVPNGFDLLVGGKRYTCINGSTHVFGIVPENGDYISDIVNEPFILTAKGLKLYKPFGSEVAQTFVLNKETSRLECVEDPTAYFESELPAVFFLRAQEKTYRWAIDVETFTGEFVPVYNRMVESCATQGGIVLKQLAIGYDPTAERKSYVLYCTYAIGNKSGKCNFDLKIEREGDDVVNISYENSGDVGALSFYERFDGFKDMIDLLSSSYKITSANDLLLNLSKIRLENIEKPNNSFILETAKK